MHIRRARVTVLVLAAIACSGDATGPAPPGRSAELLGSWNYSAGFTVAIALSTDTMQCTTANVRLEVTGPLRADNSTGTWPYWANGTLAAGTLTCSSPLIPAFSTPVAGVVVTTWRSILAAGIRFAISTPVGTIAINNTADSWSQMMSDVLEPDRIVGRMSATHNTGIFSPGFHAGTFTATRVE